MTTAIAPRFTYRHQYDEATDQHEGDNAITYNTEPSLTQQHFTKDADINEIMKRFGVTDGSILPAFNATIMDPKYFGDFSDAVDFRTAWDNVRNAEQRFITLPASLRERFANDPVKLWDFVNDPKNTDEAVKLGLLTRAPAPEAPPPTPPTTA